MKKILILFVLMIGLLALSCSSPPDKQNYAVKQNATVSTVSTATADLSVPIIYAQDVTALPAPDTPAPATGNILKDNWAAILLGLMGFAKIIVNLTPTQADNNVFGLLDNLINWIIPNLKKGGGKFT